LRELRRRVEELEAENLNLKRRLTELEQEWQEERTRQARAKEEIAIELSVAGTPAPTVARVQERSFRVDTPHSASTVKRRVRKASEVAKWLMEKFFVGQGQEVDLDEIFLGDHPLLLAVEFASMAIVGLKLAADRGGDTWRSVLEAFEHLRRASSDQAQGILQALKARGVVHLPDVFHVKERIGTPVVQFETHAYACIAKEEHAHQAREKARAKPNGKVREKAQQLRRARERCEVAVDLFDSAERCRQEVHRALEVVLPDGTINTLEQAEGRIEAAIGVAEQLPGKRGRRIKDALCTPGLLTFLDGLAEKVEAVEVPEDFGELKELVLGEIARWWRNDKKRLREPLPSAIERAVEELGADALNGMDPREVERLCTQVFEVLEEAHRASSHVETVNSIVRPRQVMRHTLSPDFVYLLALWHNLRRFRDGRRRGQSPAELLGLDLPSFDFFELLRWGEKQMAAEQSRKEPAANAA